MGTPYGTVGFFISEGGLASKYAYGAGALAAGSDYSAPATVNFGVNSDAYNNVQYHLPQGLLPFGITAKVAYAPNLSDGEGSSTKATGTVETRAAGADFTQYRVDASPIEGLTIGADYATVGSTLTTIKYAQESAGAYAKYVAGPITIGYSKAGYQPSYLKAATTGALSYETDSYGIKFAVNENLTVSYGEEKSTKRTSSFIVATSGSRTAATETDYEIEHIQAAYVIGGATLGVAIADAKNSGYSAGENAKSTIFSIAMAF